MKMSSLSILGGVFLTGGLCFAQSVGSTGSDSTRVHSGSSIRWDASFRSAQVDGASLIFSFAASGSVDLDLVNLTKDTAGKVGIRLGVEWQGTVGAGGDQNYYRDLNILFRVTAAGERGRFDVLFGTSSRGRDAWGFSPANEFAGKLGAEGRLNIIGDIFGFLGKVSISERLTFVGIGLFIGFDTLHR